MRSSIRPGRRDAQHLGAVVVAVRDPDRRPGGAARGRAELEALVRVDGRRRERAVGTGVRLQAADEVVGRAPRARARAGRPRRGRRSRRPSTATCGSGAPLPVSVVNGFGMNVAISAVLLGERVDHVAEEDRAVARDERLVVVEVLLELAVRVLVVVRVVAPAELVAVARDRRSGSRTAASGRPCRSTASRACRSLSAISIVPSSLSWTRKYSSSIPILNS